MNPRSCRLCGETLVQLYTVVNDTGDIFYICECGAVNQLRRPPGKVKPLHTNELRDYRGHILVKEVPHRKFPGGYHVEREQRIETHEEMSLVN